MQATQVIGKELAKSLEEKGDLLRELQHRVKNNLMTIISLLSIESRRLNDPLSKRIFLEAQDRIRAMMLIYEKLYRSSGVSEIDLKGYLSDLLAVLYRNYSGRPEHIRLNFVLDSIQLDLKRAVCVGLTANEVFTNSLKHAFAVGIGFFIMFMLTIEELLVFLGVSVPEEGAAC